MKKLKNFVGFQLPMLAFLMLSGVAAFAQDASSNNQSTTTHTSTTSTTAPDMAAAWYTAPWVWIVGGIVLLLILIAIFSGNKNSKSEVIRTTRVTTEVKND